MMKQWLMVMCMVVVSASMRQYGYAIQYECSYNVDNSCSNATQCSGKLCSGGRCDCNTNDPSWVTVTSQIYHFDRIGTSYNASTCRLDTVTWMSYLEVNYNNGTSNTKACKPLNLTTAQISTLWLDLDKGTSAQTLSFDLLSAPWISNVMKPWNDFDIAWSDLLCMSYGQGENYSFADSLPVVQLDGGRIRNSTNGSCQCPSGKTWNGSSCIDSTTYTCCDGTTTTNQSSCPTDYNGATAGCGDPSSATCGTSAKTYAYSDTAYAGTTCGAGSTLDGTQPSFPSIGNTSSWTCKNGSATITCTWYCCNNGAIVSDTNSYHSNIARHSTYSWENALRHRIFVSYKTNITNF